ncbi:MAG: glycosyltransferase family 39 protein, partial [Anaerolineae bacterium]|nr:glycosyltransferase family 39 protein [Anaerolineae bacterium]
RSEFWVRLPAVFFGVLALPLAYQLGRLYLGGAPGLIFAALLATSPFHIRYSQEVRPYALLVVGVFLAAYGYWRLRRSGTWGYGGLVVGGSLIFSLAHFFGTVLFVAWGIFAAIDAFILNRQRAPAVKGLLSLIAGGGLVLAILLALGWGETFFNVSNRLTESVAEDNEFTIKVDVQSEQALAPRVDGMFIRNLVISPLGSGRGLARTLWVFNGLAGLGLIFLTVRGKYQLLLFLMLWAVVPVALIVTFLVHRNEFFAPRYIISMLPAYLFVVATGIYAVPYGARRLGLSWIGVIIAAIFVGLVGREFYTGLQWYYDPGHKEDWRLVAHFLSQNANPENPVIAVNAEATMNWYYPRAAVPLNAYQNLDQIRAATAGHDRSWVIMSVFTEYLGRQDEMIKAWLSEKQAIRLELDPLIAVYYVGDEDSTPEELLDEIQTFALPVDHALYASLARENRRRPAISEQYFRLAIAHAPDEATKAQYEADLAALVR